MDIIDIILAKKMAAGVGEALVADAQKAIQDASDATAAVNAVVDDAQAASEAATAASERATAAANTYDGLLAVADQSFLGEFEELIDNEVAEQLATAIPSLETLESTVNNLDTNAVVELDTENDNTTARKIKKLKYRKKNVWAALEMMKNYTSTGTNEDGSMTQKAISDELSNLQTQINNIEVSGGSGNTNLGTENAGSIVTVGEDGNIQPSSVQENQIIEALIKTDSYSASNAIGIIIDYENKTVTRTQDSLQYNAGEDFDKYYMYGGRRRCNVNNSGQIVAWFGDNNFRDDGSNGDVMVYQPKFYYQRIPTKTTPALVGSLIQKETLLLSDDAQINFKLHPAFYDVTGHEIDYILLPAYEGCTYDVSTSSINSADASGIDFDNDILHSYADVKPISGLNNNLTIVNAEKLAQNHGEGWHITTAQALSVNQMLAIVEFGSLNIQNELESGLSELIADDNVNPAAQTGSTASLGNITGHASSSTIVINNTSNTYTVAGKRAISYRGVENPFGNIWEFIGGLNVKGNGSLGGGIIYLCKNFNYTTTVDDTYYYNTGLILDSKGGWISGLSYNNATYDWLFIPGATNGNSIVPIGDYSWITTNLNDSHITLFGGNILHEDKNGMFYYNYEENSSFSHRRVGARVMHIPVYDSTAYNNNKISWTAEIGG